MERCPYLPVVHTVKEWAEMPDVLSKKNTWYVYSDWRTDNDVNIPRFKFGDGVTMVSQLPFVTAAITDNDTEMWDSAAVGNNDLGDYVLIDDRNPKYTFPTDGYLMLRTLDVVGDKSIEVIIYGASRKHSFTFSDYSNVKNKSKEIYVRRGMSVEFQNAVNAFAEFIPLV